MEEGTHSPALRMPPPAPPLTHEDDEAEGAENCCTDKPPDPEAVPV